MRNKFKPPKDFENYIKKLVEFFKVRCGLQEYLVKLEWVNGISGRDYYAGKANAGGYTAQVDVDTRYLDITITFSKKIYKKYQEARYREIAEDVCHEFVHAHTDPYYEFLWPVLKKNRLVQRTLVVINEQQTQRISNMVMLGVRPENYLPELMD